MPRTFAVTWDYLCPFARNAHEHVVEGLRAGADWDVDFVPFSLKQTKAITPIWDLEEPTVEPGVLALLAGVAVRDGQPDRFLDAHVALFAARHDHGRDPRDETVVREALHTAGADVDAAMEAVRDGSALVTLRKQHEAAEDEHDVFGVPTFIAGAGASFVRLMRRPTGPQDAIATVERVVDLLTGWPALNEFKWTRIPR